MLISIESTIVGPSIYPIALDLGDFNLTGWILTGYLTSFTGLSCFPSCIVLFCSRDPLTLMLFLAAAFILIYNQFWYVFGAKFTLAFAIGLFTLGSLLCALAKTVRALIAFRVLQGIGASGVYSIAITIGPLLLPRAAVPKYSSLTSIMFVLGSVLGIVLGGAINQHASWRWIFWFK
jgi:MFS family permease